MRTSSTLSVTLVVALTAVLSTLAAPRDAAAQPGAQAAPGNSRFVDVPMLFRGPMPAVEVRVNGKGPFIFAIDTGASGAGRVDASLVAALSLPQSGEARGGDGSGNVQAMKVVQVESLAIGDLEIKSLSLPSRDYNASPNMPHIDGILGFNLFSDYLLTLDYAAKRVRIDKGQLPAVDGKEILEFEAARGIPTVDLHVGDVTLKAHIDTGNTIGTFIVPAALADKLTFLSPAETIGKARTVSSEIEIKRGRMKGIVRLGRFEFPDPSVTYPAISPEIGNIGSQAFADFALTFDQKNHRLRLAKHDAR